LKDFLESRGAVNLYGSKDATREAFAKGLLEDGEAWMAMIQSRNRTTHTYNQETADEIANAILSSYVKEFERFLVKFTELESLGIYGKKLDPAVAAHIERVGVIFYEKELVPAQPSNEPGRDRTRAR